MSERSAIVGMSWWGLGPEEMASEMSNSGEPCDAVILWNIRRRVDRVMMQSSWSMIEGARRLRRIKALPTRHYKAIIVISPHRFNVRMLRFLKSRSHQLIALLGDNPVGARSVTDDCWSLFDKILVADESWSEGIRPTGGNLAVMPWGSTLVNQEILNAGTYRPESLVLVGSPYPERVELAQRLVESDALTLQGNGWPSVAGTSLRASNSRLLTLETIRNKREMVVNIHHKQFHRGLNPQFYDYAAAGIPQVVVHADQLDRYRLGMDGHVLEGTLGVESLLMNSAIQGLNEEIIRRVRKSHMFSSCIRRYIN